MLEFLTRDVTDRAFLTREWSVKNASIFDAPFERKKMLFPSRVLRAIRASETRVRDELTSKMLAMTHNAFLPLE